MPEGLTSLTDVFKSYANALIQSVPTIGIAVVVFIVFWILSGVASRLVENASERVAEDESLQSLFGTTTRVAVLVVGIFSTASILFPGLKVGDLVGVLGLSSVAVGFAFKDIFQNLLAGILLLAQRPFRIGDQIVVSGYEGTVEDVELRSTSIKTHDGQKVIIPNSDVYNSPVTVKTAYEKRRTTFETGIGYGEDIETGREVIRETLESCDSILAEPEPQVFVSGHGDSSVNFDVRYWTDSRQADVTKTRDEVASKVKDALDDAGIEIPYPYRTVEFFDMSEAEDEAA
ncbi:MAG: mechanosensitive ion channel family protein [Bradymonadaceae bacterium]